MRFTKCIKHRKCIFIFDAMTCENIEYVIITFQNSSKRILNQKLQNYSKQPNKKKEIWNDRVSYFMHEKNKRKTTNAKNNCIVRIKIINKIQCTKIHRNHVVWL